MLREVHVWHFSHFASTFFFRGQLSPLPMVIGFRKFFAFLRQLLTNRSLKFHALCLRAIEFFLPQPKHKNHWINNCISSAMGSRLRESESQKQPKSIFFCVCFEITIFNFKHETTERAMDGQRRIEKCAHNRINFNDQWAFAFLFFSSKKSYFAYKNTRNQLVCKKRRKMLRDSRLARPFLPSFASWFSVRCSPFFSSPHRRVLNFINLSSTGLCINSRCWRKKKRRICKSHKLWLKLPLHNWKLAEQEKQSANRSLITDKDEEMFLFFS